MGLFDILMRPGRLSLIPAAPASLSLESPNATSSAAQIVYAEYFTGELGEVTRLAALQIPAIKKARDVLAGIVASMPLVEYENGVAVDQPWLYSTASGVSPWHRMMAIFDDLFFYDWAALAVKRDGSGQITDARHIPFERWSYDEQTGKYVVDNKPITDPREIVVIPGNQSGGILVAGAPTIKGARALERAWIGRAQNPIPLVELHQVTDDELTDGSIDENDNEIRDLIDNWSLARTSPTGAVGFTDNRVEVKTHGTVQTDLYEQGRNAIVLDIARLTGVPASILDGSQTASTLTYSTQEGKRNEFQLYSLPMWLGPIEGVLSLDSVSAKGRVIRFDQSNLAQPDPHLVNNPTKD